MPLPFSDDHALQLATRDPDTVIRVYVASPVAGKTSPAEDPARAQAEVLENILRALYCVRLLSEEGFTAVAPHVPLVMAFDEHSRAQWKLGIALDMALMAGFQRLVCFTDDGTPATLTTGMREDVARATALGLPVEYRIFPALPAGWRPSFIRPQLAPSHDPATPAAIDTHTVELARQVRHLRPSATATPAFAEGYRAALRDALDLLRPQAEVIDRDGLRHEPAPIAHAAF